MEYSHTQTGGVILGSMVVVVLLGLISLILGPFQPAPAATIIAIVALLALFYSLTVEIKNGVLVCRFGPGLIQRKLQLSDIQEASTVRNPWYAGWGIRWMPGAYWLWNVSGFQAVELLLKNGRRFRIGTDEPEALVNAIHANKS